MGNSGDDTSTPLTRRQVLTAGLVSGGLLALGPLASAAGADPDAHPTRAAGPVKDVPPLQELTTVNILPAGESGLFPVLGQAEYELNKNPADFGPHVDDQRKMYWNFQYKAAGFETPKGDPVSPIPGVRIYRGAYGVPLVYGDDGYSLWFGVGYAAAQDRLFQVDAIRRTGNGTLAELTGPTGIPADVQQRVLSYTGPEYDAMFETLLTSDDQMAVDGCIAGVNAWISEVLSDPTQLPAEYVLLTSVPQPLTRRDLMAVGVYMARNIASNGGGEFANVANLKALQAAHGAGTGAGIFDDLYWVQDDKAFTTLPAAEGTFPNGNVPADPVNGFAYAAGLPDELASGPGTGGYPVPGLLGGLGSLPPEVADGVRNAAQALVAWRAGLHGGSYQFALSPSRTAAGKAMLVNGPQLGYAYPSELYEIEVHGAGYDARGVTVAGVPLVGIGHGKRIAWGLTTGLSKTIDSFIETTRPNPVKGGPPQYLHNGEWQDQEVRTETFYYREAENGIPVGPPILSVDVPVYRTVHGPIVSTTSDGMLACSVQYATWMREVATLSGILAWNRAQTFAEFEAGVAKVTWNENTLYADAAGTIAYWHPGSFPDRAANVDLRFPVPGTGEWDWRGLLPFGRMPHAVNPSQGFLCNWNTKPAVDWLFGYGVGPPELPAGYASRAQDIADQLSARRDFEFSDLITIDETLGVKDHRARDLLPMLLSLGHDTKVTLTAQESAALDLLAGWDGTAYGPGAGTSSNGATDGPAPTIFAAVMSQLVTEVLGGAVPAALIAGLSVVGLHLFDVTPVYNVVLKVLDPSTSSLPVSYDYLQGRSVPTVLQQSLAAGLSALASEFKSTDQSAYRRPHPRSAIDSLTGVVGPSVTMPYVDRGTYIHLVAFT